MVRLWQYYHLIQLCVDILFFIYLFIFFLGGGTSLLCILGDLSINTNNMCSVVFPIKIQICTQRKNPQPMARNWASGKTKSFYLLKLVWSCHATSRNVMRSRQFCLTSLTFRWRRRKIAICWSWPVIPTRAVIKTLLYKKSEGWGHLYYFGKGWLSEFQYLWKLVFLISRTGFTGLLNFCVYPT